MFIEEGAVAIFQTATLKAEAKEEAASGGMCVMNVPRRVCLLS